jgi:hypothetical protein
MFKQLLSPSRARMCLFAPRQALMEVLGNCASMKNEKIE